MTQSWYRGIWNAPIRKYSRCPGGRTVTSLALAAASILAVMTTVQAYSDNVNQNCNDDYFSYCKQHALNSTPLRYCFEANRDKLSQRCINALVDAGEVPRKYLGERRK